MRLHYLQHVPFEDAAEIADWARARGHRLTATRLFAGELPPPPSAFDWLLVMGGPMNVYDEEAYPWLRAEKACIRESLERGTTVLGVCLGAQLLADALGARVTRNSEKEIGWHPVRLTAEARACPPLAAWPSEFTAFHWHGDTFATPPGAVGLAESEACANQAFAFGDRVFGLQFHIEYTTASIEAMLEACGDELVEGRYIQDRETMRAGGAEHLPPLRGMLYAFLDALEDGARAEPHVEGTTGRRAP